MDLGVLAPPNVRAFDYDDGGHIDRRRAEGSAMRQLVVNEFLTMDGVMQAPGG